MRSRLEQALARLARGGAELADVRRVATRRETIRVRNGEVVALSSSEEAGFGIRVLAGGSWGFASTDDEAGLEAAADLALRTARASAMAQRTRVVLSPLPPAVARWVSPVEIDPFSIPLAEKIALLVEASQAMQGDDRIVAAEGEISLFAQSKTFAGSEGSFLEQETLETGAGISVVAVSGGETQKRSYPAAYGGQTSQRGWELVRELDLVGNAPRVREEALALLAAPKAPAGTFDLVVGSSQLALQVHESCGHATELDRIFGTELSLAGGSFLAPGDLDTFRYGSPAVTIVADSTCPGGSGTFAFDDEGVPGQRNPIVDRGLLVGFLTSRETAARIGRASGGTMRAESWNHLPLIRMVNVNLEPGEVPYGELIAGTKRGFLVETNKSWSIDDRRLDFQFACEVGWEIEDGRIGRMVRNPVYTGTTPKFWGSCDAVADRASWRLWGVPNCGKGDPMQVVRVAHGASPARFRGVEMQ